MKKQVVVALFFASFLFSLGLVSAANGAEFWENTRLFVSEFINTMPEQVLVQWLFFILVLILVFGAMEFIPFVSNSKFLQTVVAVIVSILAVFFLNSEQIYAVLISYKALGITLTGILPFIVLMWISYKCHTDERKQNVVFGKILWIGFIVTLLWVIGNGFGSEADPAGNYGWIYIAVLVLSVLLFLFEGTLYTWWYSNALKRAVASSNFKSKIQRDAYVKIVKLLKERQEVIDDAQAVAIIDGQIAQIKKNAGL